MQRRLYRWMNANSHEFFMCYVAKLVQPDRHPILQEGELEDVKPMS